MVFSQLNISKMSSNSELSLQKFLHEQEIHLMALQETGCWEPTDGLFNDKIIFRNNIVGNNTLKGVAIIAKKTLCPEAVQIGDAAAVGFDAIWCQIKVGGRRILVGSLYISPSVGDEIFDNLLSYLREAQSHKLKHNFSSIITRVATQS